MKTLRKIAQLSLLAVFAAAAVMFYGMTIAEDKAPNEKETVLKPQATCPVMGGPINKGLFADVKGKRIYVCCQGCVNALKKDPDAALKKLNELGEKAEDAPAAKDKAAEEKTDAEE